MLADIIKERRKKLDRLKEAGINPYPPTSKRTALISDIKKDFSKLVESKKNQSLAGRIRGLRSQGQIAFIDLEDPSGFFQVVASRDTFAKFSDIIPNLDIGDFIQVDGPLFTTKRGQESIQADNITFLVKSILPLPTEHFGIEDTEIKLRQRYLDLILNPDVKDIFIKKSTFWASARQFLQQDGFLEVETPVLEATPGGADAEPFITHYNALDEDFSLRISLEISLKKLMVGGFEKIFEIGRIFRNEGIDAEHLQDYTQLEFYWAYADYNDLMKFVTKMYQHIIKETFGTLELDWNDQKINWDGQWEIVDYYDIFKKKTSLDLSKATVEDLKREATNLKLKLEPNINRGRLIDLIFKKAVRPHLIQPSFLIDPPADIEPLAKRHRKDPNRVERFQVMAYGTELGKGFSEANDPLDQRARFEEQMRLRAAGDTEAQQLDEDFLEALEYGMPPTAGFGFSERLFSILAGKPIREIIFFPPMKRKK